jgi:DNA primase
MPNGFVSFAELKRGVSLEAVLARYGLMENMTKKGRNLAGPCPFCTSQSQRQFQVNLEKNAWYCFGCKLGGNVLDFVAKRDVVSVRAAALKLDSWFELGLAEDTPPTIAPPAAPAPVRAVAEEALPHENPPLTFTLKTLDPSHASLAALGFQARTIELFGAGYCTKGLLKDRLAIPIHNEGGELVAYAGLAVQKDTSPRYLFPPKFHPELEVMNLHRLGITLGDGPLYLTPEIEGVLRLTEAGVTPVVGLFDGSLSLRQEEAIQGALTLCERLVLVGEDFPDRTIARLARHAAVTWISALPIDLASEEPEPPRPLKEEV